MAEEKIGSSINKKVVDQIEARKKIVGKKTGRTSEDLLYLNSKTAWVRLSSGVNTITDEEAQQYAAQEGRGTIKGSNVLAGTNILQGGLLDPNRGLREGISTATPYNQQTAYNNRPNSTGIRPMPGITGLSIASKNTYGTLREAEVQILVWTLEDFEIIERIYLRPGFTMLLEWGHTLYVRNAGNVERDVKTVGNKFFKEGISMSQILREIADLREQTDYNYEGMIGYVKNISWNYLPTGAYECTVNIISTGEILDSLKVGISPLLRGIDPGEFAPQSDDEGKEQRKSPYHFFFNKLDKVTSEVVTKESLAGISPDLGSRLEDFTGFYKEIESEDHPDAPWYGDKKIKHYWLPLRVYLDIFNKYVTQVDTSKAKTSPDYQIVKFNTDYNKSSKFLTIPEHFSIDPTVCALAYKHKLPEGVSTDFGNISVIFSNIDSNPPTNLYDDVLNILVASPFVKGVLDASLGEDYESSKGVTEILKEILSGINTALGGINDLDLAFDEDENMYTIIDRNNTPKDKSPELTLAGIDSIFTSINVNSKITNQIASQISIAAQGSTQSFTENVENILKWNPNVIDRVKPVRDPSEKDVKGQAALKQEKETEWEDWYDDVENFFGEFNGTGYEDSDMQAAKTLHKEYITYALYYQNTTTGDPPPGIVPVELSLQLEGIGGLKIGQTFTISSGILPAKYQGKFGYIITGLNHSIDNNRWLTDIKTQFYLVGKGQPQGIPAGEERTVPFVDPASSANTPTSKTAGGTTRVIEGVKYNNGEVPDNKLRFINNWQSYKGAIGSDKGRIRLYDKASTALDSLLVAAAADNIPFKINSAYRTYTDQATVFNTNCSNSPFNGASCVARPGKGQAAKPGRSNHGFGLAVDFANPGLAKLTTSMIQYKWLLANAGKFGFRRLPWGNKGENWEAWHWEYQI
jgi:LAS superfamily LD-carboxypeptidase LdcB